MFGLMQTPHPLDIVRAAWNGRWSAGQLAQCFDDMPIAVAAEILAAPDLARAARLLGIEP